MKRKKGLKNPFSFFPFPFSRAADRINLKNYD